MVSGRTEEELFLERELEEADRRNAEEAARDEEDTATEDAGVSVPPGSTADEPATTKKPGPGVPPQDGGSFEDQPEIILADQAADRGAKPKKPAPSPQFEDDDQVTITLADGEKNDITGKEANELVTATDREQFNVARKMGIVPEDSVYIETKDGWSFITAEQATAIQESDKLNGTKYYDILVKDGHDAYAKAVNAGNFISQQDAKRQDRSLVKLKKWDDGSGNYNLAEALNAGIPVATLKAAGFDADAITAAQTSATWLGLSGKERFDMMQKNGAIPRGASFESYDEKTGMVHYNLPEVPADVTESGEVPRAFIYPDYQKVMDDYLKEDPMFRIRIESMAVAKDIDLGGKPWWEPQPGLSAERRKAYNEDVKMLMEANGYSEEKARLLAKNPKDVMSILNFYAGLPEDFNPSHERAMQSLKVYAGFVPVVGTALYWEEMSTPWKVVSIVGDAFTLVSPWLRLGQLGTLFRSGLADKADDVARMVRNGSDQVINALNKVDDTLGNPYSRIIAAEADYAADYSKVRNIETALTTLQNQVKQGFVAGGKYKGVVDDLIAETEAALDAAKNAASKTEKLYSETIETFLNKVRRGGAFVDDPLLASKKNVAGKDPLVKFESDVDLFTSIRAAFDELPSQLLEKTRYLVDAMDNPRTVSTIQSELDAARSTLNQARVKYALSPEKWSDLAGEVSKLEAELMIAQTGDIVRLNNTALRYKNTVMPQLKKELTALRRQLASLGNSVEDTNIRRTIEELIPAYEKRLIQLQKFVRDAAVRIDKGINDMAVLWGKDGSGGAGRVPVATKSPPKIVPRISGGGSATGSKSAVVAGGLVDAVTRTQLTGLEDSEIGQERAPGKTTTVKPLTTPGTPPAGWPINEPLITRNPDHEKIPQPGKIPFFRPGESPGFASTPAETPGTFPGFGMTPAPEAAPDSSPGKKTATKTDIQTPQKPRFDLDRKPPPRDTDKRPTNKQGRQIIRDAKQAFTWHGGQLEIKKKLQDVWHVATDLGTPDERVFTMTGKRPRGATKIRTDKGVYDTVQTLKGHTLNVARSIDSGIVDLNFMPSSGRRGVSVTVKGDTKLETTSDLTIKKSGGKVFPLDK